MIQICLLSFISDFGIRISNFFNEGGLLDLMSMSRARVIHIVTTLPRTLSQAELIEQIKKISSKWIKTIDTRYRGFLWQRGYGAFSVSPSQLDAVLQYVEAQREHHRTRTFQEEYRELLGTHGVDFDETLCLGLKRTDAIDPRLQRLFF